MQSPNLHYQPGFAPTAPAAAPALHREAALRPERILGHRHAEDSQAPAATHELNVSGVRVLLGLGLAIGLTGLFLWGFIRDWLFAP